MWFILDVCRALSGSYRWILDQTAKALMCRLPKVQGKRRIDADLLGLAPVFDTGPPFGVAFL